MEKCEHKWVFMESIKRKRKRDYGVEYIQTDCFFCEKCLEQKQIIKRYDGPNYGGYKTDEQKE